MFYQSTVSTLLISPHKGTYYRTGC